MKSHKAMCSALHLMKTNMMNGIYTYRLYNFIILYVNYLQIISGKYNKKGREELINQS